ncbi:MAG TPA: fatty acid desaturase [Acidimicrobiales bacterium]|nr:fatty acid desaturase [Acidimicrobiales bacterium]
MVLDTLPPLVPRPDRLPDVLPTDRLGPGGKALPPLRDDLRRIPDARNAATVAGAWVQTFGVIAAAVAIDRWWAYAAAFLLMGRGFALLNILGHEAAHRLLFTRRGLNDSVGRWGLAYPGWVPLDVYRRAHMAHHKDEMGPAEPDRTLYAGYPVSRASMRRRLTRDAVGISGWKNLKPLLQALRKPSSRPFALRIVATQAVICAAMTVGGGLAAGRWWLYPVLWLAPWMTLWRVSNRLRALAEHGGMARSDDRRQTTHVVRQSMWARFWMVPYHTGWHLAHHVDPGVPWRNLPAFHSELVACGWVTDAIEYPSYVALWRALASGAPKVDAAVAPATA